MNLKRELNRRGFKVHKKDIRYYKIGLLSILALILILPNVLAGESVFNENSNTGRYIGSLNNRIDNGNFVGSLLGGNNEDEITNQDIVDITLKTILCNEIGTMQRNETAVEDCLTSYSTLTKVQACIENTGYYNVTSAKGWGLECFNLDNICVCVE